MSYGTYRNATAQYKEIEKRIISAQNIRDGILKEISAQNVILENLKFKIQDTLDSFEFRNQFFIKDNVDFQGDFKLIKSLSKELQNGLKFDSNKGKLTTSSNVAINDNFNFLNAVSKNVILIEVPFVRNVINPNWFTIKNELLSNLTKYKTTLNSINSLKLQLDNQQSLIDKLKKDLDDAAKSDPSLLKAKEEAEAKEREAKIKADAEAEQLKITIQADEQKRKEKTNKLLIVGGIGAAILLGLVILKK